MAKPFGSPKPWKPTQVPRTEPGTHEMSGGSSLEARPDHARLIGLIVLTISEIEAQIVEAHDYMADRPDWSAAEALSQMRNFQPKIASTLASIARKFGPDAEAASKKILRRASDLKKERDRLAHGRFLLRSSRPDDLILRVGWGKSQTLYAYSLANLEALLAEIYAVGADVFLLGHSAMLSHDPAQYATGRLIFAGLPPKGHPAQSASQGDPWRYLETLAQSEPPDPPEKDRKP